jgi:hypothetical protein
MGSKGKYFWRIPQGYVSIKGTPYCIKVFGLNEIAFWDRNKGHEVSMGQILEDMDALTDREREALLQFLDDYPTNEEKMLFWCNGIQRTGRVLLKKYARELEQMILSKSLKKENVHNNLQKEGVGNAEV